MRPRRASDSGQAIVVLLVGVLIATLFMVAGIEVARLVHRGVAGQNAADGAARAAATWQARGLNIIGAANVAQSLLLMEYVLPFPGMDAFEPQLAEAGRDIAAIQDSVAELFPAIGIIAASASARRAGMDPISATELRSIGFDEAADWLDELEGSGDLGRELASSMHAVPVGGSEGEPPFSLGVHAATNRELAELASDFLASDENALDMIFGQFDAPIFATDQAPVLLFGNHGQGDFSLTQAPGAEEDVMQIAYLAAPGVYGIETVVTFRGKEKLASFLGYPPLTTPIGMDNLPVVRALGPIDADLLAARFGWSKKHLLRKSIELAIEAVLWDPESGFSFQIFGAGVWKEEGASTTILARDSGWDSDLTRDRTIEAFFLARAAPAASEPTIGRMVLPIFEAVGLRQVGSVGGDSP